MKWRGGHYCTDCGTLQPLPEGACYCRSCGRLGIHAYNNDRPLKIGCIHEGCYWTGWEDDCNNFLGKHLCDSHGAARGHQWSVRRPVFCLRCGTTQMQAHEECDKSRKAARVAHGRLL